MPPRSPARQPLPDGILIIEDDPASALALAAALEELGESVVIVHSGTEALRRLLDKHFALVLLDVHMPGLDGMQTARLIRSRKRTRKLPIMFVTGDLESERRMLDAYELGAIDFLVKPIVPAVLRAKAKTLIELQRQAIELAESVERARLADELALRVAERDDAQAELERMNERLRELDRRKDDFLAVLAHELRTPLSPIAHGLALLRHDPSPERVPESVARMERQLELALRLIDDLDDVARVRAGKIELRREPLDLRAAVEDAIEASRPAIERRQHTMRARICEEELPVVGDRDRLAQIFSNLLNNAARYTPPGGEIEVEVRRESECVVVVSDTGQGISEDALETIFDAYAQAEPDSGVGLGLGLHLVRSLVAQHGGVVRAHSEGRGCGSRFQVQIPLAVRE